MKKTLIILIIFSLAGCGLIPAYRRAQSDYTKTSSMLLYGGSKRMVKSDWGEPDEKTLLENGCEIWTYKNRDDGKTFVHYFDKKGRLVRVQICKSDKCE